MFFYNYQPYQTYVHTTFYQSSGLAHLLCFIFAIQCYFRKYLLDPFRFCLRYTLLQFANTSARVLGPRCARKVEQTNQTKTLSFRIPHECIRYIHKYVSRGCINTCVTFAPSISNYYWQSINAKKMNVTTARITNSSVNYTTCLW